MHMRRNPFRTCVVFYFIFSSPYSATAYRVGIGQGGCKLRSGVLLGRREMVRKHSGPAEESQLYLSLLVYLG